jgi:hypothetical protein
MKFINIYIKIISKQLFSISLLIIFAFFFSCTDSQKDGNRDKNLTHFDKPRNDILPFFRGKDFEPYWVENGKVSYESKKVDFFEIIC